MQMLNKSYCINAHVCITREHILLTRRMNFSDAKVHDPVLNEITVKVYQIHKHAFIMIEHIHLALAGPCDTVVSLEDSQNHCVLS